MSISSIAIYQCAFFSCSSLFVLISRGGEKMKRTLLACAAVLTLMSVTHAQTMDVKKDAQKVAQTWMDAFNNKDFATVANMYSDDGVFSNQWFTEVGQQAIGKAFKSAFINFNRCVGGSVCQRAGVC
jgi:hypothetical protein